MQIKRSKSRMRYSIMDEYCSLFAGAILKFKTITVYNSLPGKETKERGKVHNSLRTQTAAAFYHLLYFTAVKKRDYPKFKGICRHQETCRYNKEGKCRFLHVDPSLLVGKKTPYKPCFRHPKCKNNDCEYIHLPLEAEEDEPSNKKSKVEDNQD